jgi:hypothetical protein
VTFFAWMQCTGRHPLESAWRCHLGVYHADDCQIALRTPGQAYGGTVHRWPHRLREKSAAMRSIERFIAQTFRHELGDATRLDVPVRGSLPGVRIAYLREALARIAAFGTGEVARVAMSAIQDDDIRSTRTT